MKATYRLIRERCRVGTFPGTSHLLQIVYGLDHPLPSGSRKVLAPTLTQSLAKESIQLFALDLFDEMIRIHLPLDANANSVEKALSVALASLEEVTQAEISKDDLKNLERYAKKSSH